MENILGIIPSELTLVELCNKLNTTPSWVNKAIRDFNLSREGRGRLRRYTKDEFIVLYNAKMLLQIGYSLTYLKDLQKEEAKVRDEIIKRIGIIERDVKAGKTKIDDSETICYFLLNPRIVTNIYYVYEIDKDGKEYKWEFWKRQSDFPKRYIKDIAEKLDKVSSEIEKFRESLNYFYEAGSP